MGDQVLSIENFGNLQSVKISDSECAALVEFNSQNLPTSTGKEAISFTRSLFGMYRKADFHDPDIFSTALCTVFAAYPAVLCRQVVDPLKGLPSQLSFPPSIAEVKQALDNAMSRRKNIAFRANLIQERRALEISTFIRNAAFARCQVGGSGSLWREKAAALVQLANPDLFTEEAALTEVDERIAKLCVELNNSREKRRAEREGQAQQQDAGTPKSPIDIADFMARREPDERERERKQQAELDQFEEQQQEAARERARRSDAEKEPRFVEHMLNMRAQETEADRKSFEAQKTAAIKSWQAELGLDNGGDAA